KRQQIVSAERHQYGPARGVGAWRAQVNDLTALRRYLEPNTRGLEHLARPGPGSDQNRIGLDRLGIHTHAQGAPAAHDELGAAAHPSRSTLSSGPIESAGHPPTIYAGAARDEQRRLIGTQRRK